MDHFEQTRPSCFGLRPRASTARGEVKASCEKEAGALAYLFQFGTDPNHPETWPAPIVARGHTYTLRNQTIGQVLCARIAVVRHGSVRGAWSIVLQLTVR